MKMKFGAIVVAGSGKIGGHVASKNRAGAYLRTKTTPSNPNTAAQANVRGILGSLASSWSDLTADQRLSWNNAVQDYASTDIFGDIKNPSGFNLYIKLNSVNALIAQALLTVAPAKVELPFAALVSATMTVDIQSAVLDFDGAALDGETLIVYATPPLSAGISNAKNRFRMVSSGAVAAGNLAFGADYVAKFGAFALGQNIQIGYKVVGSNGQTSPMFITTATIAAT